MEGEGGVQRIKEYRKHLRSDPVIVTIQKKLQGTAMAKVLILTPVIQPGGNLATMTRIRSHLETQGYHCELKSSADLRRPKDVQSYVTSTNTDVIIAIHALKTGTIVKDCSLPYILILGGSDVSVCAQDPHKLAIMGSAISKARYIVSFSNSLKRKAEGLWPCMGDVKVKIVPQAVETLVSPCPGVDIEVNEVNENESPVPALVGHDVTKAMWSSGRVEQCIVFSLIAGIRPVKDPLYLVSTFQEWHELDTRILYLVVGHRLDMQYSEKVLEPEICRKPGVLYIPGVDTAQAHLLMKNSFAVVNSSVDEGMSLAILEAMQLKVPVLARDNFGNSAIVSDGSTGLLFDSKEVFLNKAKQLLLEPHIRDHLIQNAFKYVETHHCIEEEKKAYINMVQHCITLSTANDITP